LGARSLTRAASLALACVLLAAAPSWAADARSFARQISTLYHLDTHHIITADIDRDGDLDVVAATDGGFMVWLNDGAGRFTSQAPRERPLVDGHPSGDSWSGDEARDNETILNGTSSVPLAGEYGHAPPRTSSQSAVPVDAGSRNDTSRGCRVPRAPPAVR
jgi:hypothetical protein